ncbi:hypothetical protein NL676_030592 [Syzygium grande]|nr:hypothetical protein NL676_030592 [Syzygium grande]
MSKRMRPSRWIPRRSQLARPKEPPANPAQSPKAAVLICRARGVGYQIPAGIPDPGRADNQPADTMAADDQRADTSSGG